ncbi:MAG: TonB-dependent receptor [Microscillaceae bacterium]
MYAQVELEVSIYDLSNRQPIPAIKVVLQNQAIGFTAEKITNEQGKVRFTGLSVAGLYQVAVPENEQYEEALTELFPLRAQEKGSVQLLVPAKRDLALPEIVVRAVTTKINTIHAEVASSLSQQEISELPIEGRDITRALFRLPNVVQATGFYPEAPNVSINGANSLFTNYMIDGLDNNERFLGGQKFALPVGFTRSITVLTNNYSTEFGLTGNGIVNLTSRSGSNETTGEAFFLTRPGPALDAASPYAQRDLSGNQVKDGFQRYQLGFGIGGAFKKDKTFYYLNAEQTIDIKDNLLNSPALGVNETVRGNNYFTYLSGKIDHFWSRAFSTSLRVNYGLVQIERQGGGLEGGLTFPSAGNAQDRNSLLIALKNLFVKNNYSHETNLQFARFRWNYARPQNENSPQVTVLSGSETIAVLGHPGFVFDSRENTVQWQEKFQYETGRHSLKAGFELISAEHSLFGGGNPNGNYLVSLSESELAALQSLNRGSNLSINDIPAEVEVLNVNIELRPNSFGKRQNIYSVYLEDAFSVSNRLNLTFGLRYDYDNLSRSGGQQGDFNNVAPRFSFNYKISPASVIRGGYGIFYEKILYAVYSDALQQNTTDADYRRQLEQLVALGLLPADTDIDRITFEGNLSASPAGVTYLNAPSPESLQSLRAEVFSNERRILNPNGWDNPFTHQISLGYQYQIDKEHLFYLDLVHNRSHNLFRLRDLNAPAPFTSTENDPVRTVAEADATRPVPIFEDFALINGEVVNGVARNVIVSESEGESRYYAASFNLQKDKGDGKVSYRLIYTLSFLENNTEDINFRAEDANDYGEEWGPSINDRRHVINGIFNYYPVKNLSFSLAALLQSGQPINRIPDAALYGTTDLNGDGRSFGDAYVGNSDRQPGESRNNDRLPWSNTFDIRAIYQLPLGKGQFLELSADVFNVLNAENLSGYANNATQSNQIQVGPKSTGLLVRRNAAPPRQFQFGVRYLF